MNSTPKNATTLTAKNAMRFCRELVALPLAERAAIAVLLGLPRPERAMRYAEPFATMPQEVRQKLAGLLLTPTRRTRGR